MTIFKTAILPYKYFFANLKINLNINILVSLILYGLFFLYSKGVVDRIIGSGNKDTLLMLKLIIALQNIVGAFLLSFCFRKLYITTICSNPFITKINIKFNIIESSSLKIRLFIIYIIIVQILLSSLSVITNYDFTWLILICILFPRYFVIFPAYILIERPDKNYIQSMLILNEELHNKKIKLILITAITAVIFLSIQNIGRIILGGFISYNIIQSQGQEVTTGLMLSTVGLYDFITEYIGMIIYVKLSLILYLKFKVQIPDTEFK